jgi:hypothetical protein
MDATVSVPSYELQSQIDPRHFIGRHFYMIVDLFSANLCARFHPHRFNLKVLASSNSLSYAQDVAIWW